MIDRIKTSQTITAELLPQPIRCHWPRHQRHMT